MKRLILGMAVLTSLVAFAEQKEMKNTKYNIYTKVGANLTDNNRDYRDLFSVFSKLIGQKNEFIRGYHFNVEATKNINDIFELGLGTSYVHNKQYTFDYIYESNKKTSTKVFSLDYIPVYLTAKMNFLNTTFNPYIKGDLGIAFNTNYKGFVYTNKDLEHGGGAKYNNVLDIHNGLYVGGAVGFEYKNLLVEFNVSHVYNDITINKSDEGNTYYHRSDKYTKFKGNTVMGVNLGYKFSF